MRILLVQHTTGPDPAANRVSLRAALDAASDAAGPADLVLLPEASQADFGSGERPPADVAEPIGGPFTSMLAEWARTRGTTVVAGMFEASAARRPFNTLVVVAPNGDVAATYRKTHLYDAFGYRESDLLSAGDPVAVTVDVPVRGDGGAQPAGSTLRVGLMTCYDLRFPEQARALMDAGAELLAVPAAWLRGPGKERHWATLLAARAIENTVFVAGAAKSGERYCGLSQVIDPMGVVLGGLGEEDGSFVVDVDRDRMQQVRRVNPSLAHRRWSIAEKD